MNLHLLCFAVYGCRIFFLSCFCINKAVGFEFKMLEKKAISHKFLPSKNKLKPLEQMRKTSKCSESYRKIPKVIGELEKNIMLLKKYYEEEENYQMHHIK